MQKTLTSQTFTSQNFWFAYWEISKMFTIDQLIFWRVMASCRTIAFPNFSINWHSIFQSFPWFPGCKS